MFVSAAPSSLLDGWHTTKLLLLLMMMMHLDHQAQMSVANDALTWLSTYASHHYHNHYSRLLQPSAIITTITYKSLLPINQRFLWLKSPAKLVLLTLRLNCQWLSSIKQLLLLLN